MKVFGSLLVIFLFSGCTRYVNVKTGKLYLCSQCGKTTLDRTKVKKVPESEQAKYEPTILKDLCVTHEDDKKALTTIKNMMAAWNLKDTNTIKSLLASTVPHRIEQQIIEKCTGHWWQGIANDPGVDESTRYMAKLSLQQGHRPYPLNCEIKKDEQYDLRSDQRRFVITIPGPFVSVVLINGIEQRKTVADRESIFSLVKEYGEWKIEEIH